MASTLPSRTSPHAFGGIHRTEACDGVTRSPVAQYRLRCRMVDRSGGPRSAPVPASGCGARSRFRLSLARPGFDCPSRAGAGLAACRECRNWVRYLILQAKNRRWWPAFEAWRKFSQPGLFCRARLEVPSPAFGIDAIGLPVGVRLPYDLLPAGPVFAVEALRGRWDFAGRRRVSHRFWGGLLVVRWGYVWVSVT